jgi:hypothetical protein
LSVRVGGKTVTQCDNEGTVLETLIVAQISKNHSTFLTHLKMCFLVRLTCLRAEARSTKCNRNLQYFARRFISARSHVTATGTCSNGISKI